MVTFTVEPRRRAPPAGPRRRPAPTVSLTLAASVVPLVVICLLALAETLL